MALVRRLRTGIQAYAEDARLALRMAPVEVALGLLTAATLSWAIEADAKLVADWKPGSRDEAGAAAPAEASPEEPSRAA